tara:strand:+ start:4213 stop:4500 length:288 start_codon:yes stop_codon:yes gene_type:complete
MAKNYNKGKVIGMNNPTQQAAANANQNININPDDLTDIVCEKCESQTFEPVFMFKKLSAVLSPSGKDTMVPLQTYRCTECTNINKEFMPKTKPDA